MLPLAFVFAGGDEWGDGATWTGIGCKWDSFRNFLLHSARSYQSGGGYETVQQSSSQSVLFKEAGVGRASRRARQAQRCMHACPHVFQSLTFIGFIIVFH